MSLSKAGGMTVHAAATAEEGVRLVRVHNPDVVLLDLVMPDHDGKEVLAILRGRPDTAQVPVVFLTAGSARTSSLDLIGLGAIGVISKPFNPLTLADEVRAVLRSAGTTPRS